MDCECLLLSQKLVKMLLLFATRYVKQHYQYDDQIKNYTCISNLAAIKHATFIIGRLASACHWILDFGGRFSYKHVVLLLKCTDISSSTTATGVATLAGLMRWVHIITNLHMSDSIFVMRSHLCSLRHFCRIKMHALCKEVTVSLSHWLMWKQQSCFQRSLYQMMTLGPVIVLRLEHYYHWSRVPYLYLMIPPGFVGLSSLWECYAFAVAVRALFWILYIVYY